MKKIIIVLLIGLMPLILQAQKAAGNIYGKIPLYFIANKEQVNPQAQFYAKASKYTLWMTKKGLVFDSSHSPYSPHSPHSTKPYLRDVSRLIFVNANKNPVIIPVDMSKHRVNVFAGRDHNKWKTDIPTSKAVVYKNLYQHIDLKVYGIEKQVEYDWLIKPGGNPQEIRFKYQGVKKTQIDKEGNLLIETTFAEWIHKKPMGYQEIRGEQRAAQNRTTGAKPVAIDVKFKKIGKNIYGFEVGEYDKRYELIIDPVVLAYSIYLGETYENYGEAIAVDGNGNAYISGFTGSSDFPTRNAFQENLMIDELGGISQDVFITKLSPSGDALDYSTYFGGEDWETGSGIALDSFENAYVIASKGDFNFEDVYVLAAKIGNLILNIQVSRQEERAWLIRIQYAEIMLTVDNPGDIPVSNYVIYRKEANGTNQYQAIIDIPAPEVQDNTYTYYDLLPREDRAYTYKIEALDANGEVIGVSYEQTI